MTLILDIETVPLASALAAPYPVADRQPPGNYKNPDAIAKWRESDQAVWASARSKECSLNPRLGRVLCIGLNGTVEMAKTEDDEAKALVVFWDAVKVNDGEVITWNGAWDLRFLVIRSLVHGILPTIESRVVRSWFKRYVTYPHFDCRAVLTNWEPYRAGEGLEEWSAFFGVNGKAPGMSGADVYPLYQAGEFEKIATYCQQDVDATRAVYERIAPMFETTELVA